MFRQEVGPIYHRGHNGRGILLIHGFTGTTLEMKPLAEFFRGMGYAISAPLLKGHGTTPEQLKKTSWKDWLLSAEEGYHQLALSGCRVIYTIGLSMGGLLALKLSEKYPFRVMATLSSPIFVWDKRIKYTRYLKWIVPYKLRTETKAPHIEQHLIPYPRTPLASIHQLHELIESTKVDLPKIQTPIFIAQGEADETVNPASGDYIYGQIGSNYKKLARYPDSSHIITLDHESHKLFMDIAHYFEEVTFQEEGE